MARRAVRWWSSKHRSWHDLRWLAPRRAGRRCHTPSMPPEPLAPMHAAFLERRYFASLDGVRCLAILPVVFHHSTPRPLEGLAGKGPLGVHLFFAVSGFLITTLLLRERRQTGAIQLPHFYARRALRIFPLYYLVLVVYVLRAVLVLEPSPMREHFIGNVIYFSTYTSNFMVDYGVAHPVIFAFAWSLATEEQFYLVWPPALRLLGGRLSPALLAAALLVVDLGAERGALRALLGAGVLFSAVTSISTPICLGCLAALALEAPGGFRMLGPLLCHRIASPLALAGLLALVAWGAPLLWIHVAMVALVASVCVREDHGLRALFEQPLVARVGVVSYGIYLFHVGVIAAVRMALPSAWLGEGVAGMVAVFAASAALSFGLASVSYRYFEGPLLRLRQRFRAPGTAEGAAVAVGAAPRGRSVARRARAAQDLPT